MVDNPYQPLPLNESITHNDDCFTFSGTVTRRDLEALIGTRKVVFALWFFFAATLGPFALIAVAQAVFDSRSSVVESLPVFGFLLALIAVAAWASFLLTKRSRVSRIVSRSPRRLDEFIAGTIDRSGLTISSNGERPVKLTWDGIVSVYVTANGLKLVQDPSIDDFFAIPARTISDFNSESVQDFITRHRQQSTGQAIISTTPNWADAPDGSFHVEAFIQSPITHPAMAGNAKMALFVFAGCLVFALLSLIRFDTTIAPFFWITGLTILVLAWDARQRHVKTDNTIYQYWGWLADGEIRFHFPGQTYASDASNIKSVVTAAHTAVLTFDDPWVVYLGPDNLKNRDWREFTAWLRQFPSATADH